MNLIAQFAPGSPNLIGRTIFLTSEKISYDQSQAADEIFH